MLLERVHGLRPANVLPTAAGQRAAKATTDALTTAEHRTLDGQPHDVAPDAPTPGSTEFFGP
jgi:hypothetical protein